MDKIRIGIFGARRGRDIAAQLIADGRFDIAAVCERDDQKREEFRSSLAGDIAGARFFADFDSFLDYGKAGGFSAVFLANFFHQHAPYAIKAMEAGLDVASECTAASTLRECAQLAEAVERTGRRYILAENYPFTPENLKMADIARSGALGSLLYCEGEYNHSGSVEELKSLSPGRYHWRTRLPRTYYLTHALGPLMYMTGGEPLYVSARAAHSALLEKNAEVRKNFDGTAIMLCELSGGAIARFTGCTGMASDYSRYRVVGDEASIEAGGNIGDRAVRMYWFPHTRPENEPENCRIIKLDKLTGAAAAAGHGGSDFVVAGLVYDYFSKGEEPFFNVYRACAMSATAILGWRSCLEHGANYRIPDFRDPAQRALVMDDDLTPFPDENGDGATLPCALPKA